MDTDIMTLEDVARELKQPQATIRELFENGVMPGRKIGDTWYLSRRQLMAFIEGRSTAGEHSAPPNPASSPRPATGRRDQSWTCTKCHSDNEVQFAECPLCGAVRDTPLIGYIRN